MPFQDKKLIGQIIKRHRKQKSLTQEKLSEMIDISEKHLGQIERGAFLPNISNFFKIIEILEINLSEFGIKNENKLDTKRENLIKTIYSLNEKNIDICADLIEVIKNKCAK